MFTLLPVIFYISQHSHRYETLNDITKTLLQQSGDALFWCALSNSSFNSTQFLLLSKFIQILEWTLKLSTLKFHEIHHLIMFLLYDGICVAIPQVCKDKTINTFKCEATFLFATYRID